MNSERPGSPGALTRGVATAGSEGWAAATPFGRDREREWQGARDALVGVPVSHTRAAASARVAAHEIDGIQPDVLIGFRRTDTPRQRAERLSNGLPGAVRGVLR